MNAVTVSSWMRPLICYHFSQPKGSPPRAPCPRCPPTNPWPILRANVAIVTSGRRKGNNPPRFREKNFFDSVLPHTGGPFRRTAPG